MLTAGEGDLESGGGSVPARGKRDANWATPSRSTSGSMSSPSLSESERPKLRSAN